MEWEPESLHTWHFFFLTSFSLFVDSEKGLQRPYHNTCSKNDLLKLMVSDQLQWLIVHQRLLRVQTKVKVYNPELRSASVYYWKECMVITGERSVNGHFSLVNFNLCVQDDQWELGKGTSYLMRFTAFITILLKSRSDEKEGDHHAFTTTKNKPFMKR